MNNARDMWTRPHRLPISWADTVGRDEIREAHEAAKAVNARNALQSAGVDALLRYAGWAAVVLVAGCFALSYVLHELGGAL